MKASGPPGKQPLAEPPGPKVRTTRVKMSLLLRCLLLLWLPALQVSADWCYNNATCGPSTWVTLGMCNGTKQSPININSSAAVYNASLGAFSFTGYDSVSSMVGITNNGHSVEVELGEGVSISGGGLPDNYVALQFHFHWGNNVTNPGSEHRLNGNQFPMELHIVHTRKGVNLTTATSDPQGIAVLGFFINGVPSNVDSTGLSNILKNISTTNSKISNPGLNISINTLLSGVDLTKYFRYSGSLTTPNCSESVIWTVFNNPILLPSSLINALPATLLNAQNVPLVNVFRPPQPLNSRQVMTSMKMASTTTAPTSSSSTTKSSSGQDATRLPSLSGLTALTLAVLVSLLFRN
ncbi:carbonic anhydrase 4-like [Erpetoichthys calabaricus]|uniref:carbonic anhydrase 4-like n=1 Tax=Erpetoichthys calabaricus TaxID=27687 RepID=UPI0022349D8F|nr:carbonic anhydrase 4-like [Erpetoichthys calabaricus]